jgi:hypothetical protein
MRHRIVMSPLLWLSACGPAADQQARITELLTIACNVDGVLVPVARPLVATRDPAGANADLLVHPAVVEACRAVAGTPVSVMAVRPGN